ncbi:group III truncated hemoglobin [Sphingomonas sp. RB3P16]|uniref:group III truncated hemoglobin n=1 Tax=Parasphingomonas frigoris TaxID=3096163 RepID=UPI002FC68A16
MSVQPQIQERAIEPLLSCFYGLVREDEMLGPVFNAAVGDWPAHIRRLTDFWSSVMLTSGRYKGNPVAIHLEHAAALTPAMFGRWLTLWREATAAMLPAAAAEAMQAKAERIAESLQLAITYRPQRTQQGVTK